MFWLVANNVTACSQLFAFKPGFHIAVRCRKVACGCFLPSAIFHSPGISGNHFVMETFPYGAAGRCLKCRKSREKVERVQLFPVLTVGSRYRRQINHKWKCFAWGCLRLPPGSYGTSNTCLRHRKETFPLQNDCLRCRESGRWQMAESSRRQPYGTLRLYGNQALRRNTSHCFRVFV